VMNDAVAITLFRSTGKFVGISIGAEEGVIAFIDFVVSFVTSVIIGYSLGLFSAWIFKTIDMSHHRLVLAKRAAAFVFEIMAYMSETAVFLYMGMAVFAKSNAHSYHASIILWTLVLIIISRAMHVYPLLSWVNWYREKRAREKNRRPNLIPRSTKHMVFFSGLRGAVAYACANIFPDQNGNRCLIAVVIVLHGYSE
ncbi:SLC9A8, partial [Symbiodinium microadriaticum]